MKFFKRLFFNGLAFYVTALIVPGMHLKGPINGITAAVVAGILFSIVNVTIRPLLKIITFPITIVTLGLFSIIINFLMLWFVAYLIPNYLYFDGIISSGIAFIVLSVVNAALGWLEK